MSTAYYPQPGTIPAKAIAYLHSLPESERPIATAVLAEAIGHPGENPRPYLGEAIEHKALEVVRRPNEKRVYWDLGTGAAAIPTHQKPTGGATDEDDADPLLTVRQRIVPATESKGIAAMPNPFHSPKKSKKLSLSVTPQDISALKVEVGIPLDISVTRGKGASKWQPLFNKLNAPDTSLVFPISWKSAVAAAATKHNQAAKKTTGLPTYRVAIVSETQARIWRTA